MYVDACSELKNIDVCIIGSGIAGGTVASTLLRTNKTFVIVEAGGNQNTLSVSEESIGRGFGIRTTRSIQLGGTSNLWHGVLAPLDEVDFQYRYWIPRSGWPISASELMSSYNEASEILGLYDYHNYKVKNLCCKYKEQISALPFNKEHLQNKIFQQPLPTISFKKKLNKICSKSERSHICLNTVALELIIEDGSVKKLKVGLPDGKSAYIYAKSFVVCAGALESPRLLLNSGVKNENLGRYLMDHPMGNLFQIKFKQPKKYPIYSDTKFSSQLKIKSGFTLPAHMQQKNQMANHCFFLRPSFIKGINNESEKVKLSLLAFKDKKVSKEDLCRLIKSPNVIRQILAYKYSLNVTFKYADIFFVTEQRANYHSCVSLSAERDKWGYKIASINWKVSDDDKQEMLSYYSYLTKECFQKPYFDVTHNMHDLNWDNTFTSACHHLGTVSMGDNEKNGCVDKNLLCFGTDNLFVCDGSVFRTSGNANPSLTIAALAVRLGKYLGKIL